jgi:dihydrofolate synthase/folylpolyglutamate synthase
MNYQQTLDYLYTRLPMFSRIGSAAYKADLSNTIKLCGELGNPQNKFKSIHIGGTNGKGSTSHMLAAILQTAGYKTGLYTSPHLKDFRERIKINGKMIEEDYIVDFTQRIQPMIDKLEPSFFEITVVMAYECFAAQQVDIAVVEVGLGGRLDSTNIITPELCIITNIGRDHMNILGDTVEKIAYEKAGIIKPGVPVIIGETLAETKQVFEEKAAGENAPIVFANEKRWVADWHIKNHLLQVSVADSELDDQQEHYTLDLAGLYQVKNILPVIEAVHLLREKGWKIKEEQLQEALQHVKRITGLHGRWEVVHHHPRVILDVSHNEDGIKQIVQQLELTDFDHLHIVIGFVKDKEISAVLKLLPHNATYYFTKAQIARALPEDELAMLAETAALKGLSYVEVNMALREALSSAKPNDLVLVCGSVFLVGEVNLF